MRLPVRIEGVKIMKKILTALIIMLMSVSASNAAGKEIVYNLGVEPQTIDPALNTALYGANVDINIFEGLLRINFNNEPEPGCAESWDISPDGLKWTFHLSKNLRWSDGKPLTASHFRDGILRLITPETGAAYAYVGFFIKNSEAFYNGKAELNDVGISAPDDKTLIIELERFNPLMLYYMAFPSFFPARMDIISGNPRTWAAKPETLISNGPFKLESWTHGSGGEINIVKNHEYWDAENVKIDKVRLVMIEDSNTAYASFKGGRIDFMSTIPSLMKPLLIKKGEAEVSHSLSVIHCLFNVTRKPFDDARVRRAFSLAVDRKILTDKIVLGGHLPATGAVCSGIPGTNVSEDFRTEGGELISPRADIEEARRLLAEAGYPDGKGFPNVTYKYSTSKGGKMLAEVLQGMWKTALGIEVVLSNEEWKVFLTTMHNGDFDIASFGWVMDFPDAAGLLEIFMSNSSNNESRYNNPEFDSLMNSAAVERDRVKRINYLHEAEKILMKDLPVMPLYFVSSAVMRSSRVKGIYLSPTDYVIFRGAEVLGN